MLDSLTLHTRCFRKSILHDRFKNVTNSHSSIHVHVYLVPVNTTT